MPSILTSYGEIRPWRMEDAGAIVKHANNRNVWLKLRDAFPHPYTPADAQAFLEMTALQNPPISFAIATQEEAIGGIGITLNGDIHRLTAEMGYWLAEPYWGKGIMTESVARFTDYVFDNFELVRIYAGVHEGNPASCRVLEKAGFLLEGRMRANVIKDGRILDQFLYAKLHA